MNESSGTSWKTTTSAAVSAFGGFVLFSQQLHYVEWPGWLLSLALFASIGGLAAFGISSKDSDVTGGRDTGWETAAKEAEAELAGLVAAEKRRSLDIPSATPVPPVEQPKPGE